MDDDPNSKPGFQCVVQQFACSDFEHVNILLLSSAAVNHLLDQSGVNIFAAN